MTESRWEIPNSWAWVAAGGIASIVGGGTPTASDPSNFCDDGIPWLTPADLTGYKSTYVEKGRRDLTQKGFASCGATLLPKGTVLYSSRAPIGYCVIARNPICTSQGFKSLVPAPGILPEFIRHYLLGSKDYAESLASGTTFKELSGARVAQLAIPVAPETEQRRVAAKLDSLLARSARARHDLDSVSKLIERYKLAILAKAFCGELTGAWRTAKGQKYVAASDFVKARQRVARTRMAESGLGRDERSSQILADDDLNAQLQTAADNSPLPADWSWASLGQVFGVYVGATPSRKIPEYWNGIIPWVSSGEVAFCTITKTHESITQSGLDNASTRIHPKRTVLLGMIGEGKTRGQTAILDIPACNNQNCAAIRVSEAEYPPEYVYWYLYFAYEQTRTAGAGNNQPALNKDRVQRLPIPLAPPGEAVAVAAAIQNAFAWLDKIATEQRHADRLLPKLDQAILAKAFCGELVPQDPNDEPASVLLERIREGRATEDMPKRGRKSSAPKSPREKAVMTKSRQDEDVKNKPYLADIIRETGGTSNVEELFRKSDLPITDFYKQLAWEVDQGHIRDQDNKALQAA